MFRVMAEKSLVGVYLIQDGKFQYVNPKMAELWGYEANELIGKSPLEFIHPDDRETVEKNIKLRIKGEIESVNYKLRVVRKDGEIRVNEVYGSRTIFRGKPAIIGTLIDKIRCYTAVIQLPIKNGSQSSLNLSRQVIWLNLKTAVCIHS
ncbi:PAS domain S-box protein [Archaeoglobus sp.]